MLQNPQTNWQSSSDHSFLDYGNNDPVHHWRRMPTCDEFVGARRSKHTMVAFKGAVYVFGGDNGKSMLNDLLRFDMKEKSWVRAFTSSLQRPPAPRYHHSAVVYDTSMFIFGGYTGDIPSNSNLTNNNDLYEYNFKTGQWIRWFFKGLAPVPRSAHGAAVYDGKLWILAGYDGNARLNDMWTISLQSYAVHIDSQYGEIRQGEWERIEQLGDCPPTCCNFPVAVAGDSMYVFSGHSGAKITDSLFQFHFPTKVWTRISTYKMLRAVPSSPTRRYGHTMVAYDNNLYVFGGTADFILPNDLHRFDLETNTWSIVQVTSNSEIPSGRLFHTAAVDDGCMFIFGGTIDYKIRSGEIFRFKFSNYPRCTLHSDFSKILETKLFSDVDFIIGKDKVKFPCHIAIITARSTWLTERIQESMSERENNTQLNQTDGLNDTTKQLEVHLHDVVPDAFEMILEYIYSDRIDPARKCKRAAGEDSVELQGENSVGHHILLIMDVYILAKQMEMTRLQQLCLHYIEALINEQNVLIALRTASSLGLTLIKNLCLKFTVKHNNYVNIILSTEFENLDGHLMVEIVRENQIPNSKLYEKPSLEPGHTLEEDMESLLHRPELSDITLVLHDTHIPAHKAILAARCGYFEAMFRSFMPKDNLVKIQIGEVFPSQQSLESLLKYIYYGNVTMPPQDSLYLYSASHFYSFTNNRLQAFCKENLEMNMSCNNVLDILEAAIEIQATEIKDFALHLIVSNFKKVAQLPKLRTLSRELLLDILIAIGSDMQKEKLKLCQEITTPKSQCGHESPCEQLCFEVRDRVFECFCKVGYVLHHNGYSCITDDESLGPQLAPLSLLDDGDDIIYQKDASISVMLETPKDLNNIESINEGRNSNVTTSEVPTITSKLIDDIGNSSSYSVSSTKIDNHTVTTEYAFHNVTKIGHCDLDCGLGGHCLFEMVGDENEQHYQPRCQCPLHKIGPLCEEDVEIRMPRFNGRGWMAFPALRAAYKRVQLEIEFRPEKLEGIIFITGERDDLAGDFIALVLHQGFVEFRFDCGSGVGVVRSDETVLLNKWNKLIVHRHRWDAWIQLNNGRHVQGRSKGLFSRITFQEPVFIGGKGNISILNNEKIPAESGFVGCIRFLEVNGKLYNFAAVPSGDAISSFDVDECSIDPCSATPCKNGGQCFSSDETASSTCICSLGFTGYLCEIKLDLQVPLFNGTSYLKYDSIGMKALSWLDIEVVLKPIAPDGLILYNGRRLDGVGDFIAIYISSGYLSFTFDLGNGIATLRSSNPVKLNAWHSVKIWRTGRLAVLQIDRQQPVKIVAPGAFTQLSVPMNMYLGGVPNYDIVSPRIKVKNSFYGCVQKMVINEKPLKIISEAISGFNIDSCQHECNTKPCGNEQLVCYPIMNEYKCLCEHNCQKLATNESVSYQNKGAVLSSNDFYFFHYTDPEITKRITSDNMSINIRFRTAMKTGLLLWYGDTKHRGGDFLSLGIVNGFLELTYNVGNGDVYIMSNSTAVNDGNWHRVNVFRDGDEGSLMIDSEDAVVKRSTGPLTQINADSGLFLGGMENIAQKTDYRYHEGLRGCISDLVLNSDYEVQLSRAVERPFFTMSCD